MLCPHCHREIDEEPAVTVEQLERDCRARGHAVYPGGRVHENVAAEILGLSPQTLRTWRSKRGGAQLPFVRAGHHGRVSYRLTDLCDYLDYED